MPKTWDTQGNLAEREAYTFKASFQEQPLDTASSHALIFYFKHPVRLFSKILISFRVSDSGCQDGLVKQVQTNSSFLYSIAF